MDGEIKVMNLMCRVVEERHLAVNIQKWIKKAQDDYNISNSQLLTFTIDSAANMTKAVDSFIDDMNNEEQLLEDQEKEENDEEFEDDSGHSLHVEIDENDDVVEIFDDRQGCEQFYDLTLPATRIHCAVHRLQLGVNDFLRKKPFVKVITIAQKLTAKLRTPTARLLLKKENLKSPIMFQETRWSSTLKMLDRLLELKDFCKENQELWKGM